MLVFVDALSLLMLVFGFHVVGARIGFMFMLGYVCLCLFIFGFHV